MIEKLKALQQEKKIPKTLLKSIIKTKEYVDTDALESALYNDKIKGPDLSGCFSQKEIVTFRLKEIKEKKSSKKQEDEE
jgi:hypothetical protein